MDQKIRVNFYPLANPFTMNEHVLREQERNQYTVEYYKYDHPSILESTTKMQQDAGGSDSELDTDDLALLQDDELDAVHREAVAAKIERQKEEERIEAICVQGLEEGEALEVLANNFYCVLLFTDNAFQSCGVITHHLNECAKQFEQTKFIAVDAKRSDWLCKKMKVKTLPSMIFSVDGKIVDKVVGLDCFGGRLDFTTNAVIKRLREAGVVPDSYGNYRKRAPRVTELHLSAE